MNKGRNLIITTVVMSIVLTILAIGNLDFDISRGIINKTSHFGEFFNRIGEIPAMLGMLIGVAILYGNRSKKSLIKNITATTISIPFMLLFSFATIFMPIRYVYEFSDAGIPGFIMNLIYVGTTVLFIFTLIFINRQSPESLVKYKKYGLILILVIVGEMILVNVLKIVWARPRMRSIDTITQFKYWYQINGPLNSEEFKSFPSGHTANGFVMIAYSMFIPNNRPKFKKWFIAFALTWGVCVALSRIILGAHFLSDVAMGGYVTTMLFYILSNLILKKERT